MDNPWGDFEQAMSEREFLPPVKIAGEEFTFPKSPPALMRLRIANIARKNDGQLPIGDVIELLVQVLDDEAFEKALIKITEKELDAFLTGLLRQWDFTPADDDANPTKEDRVIPVPASSTTSEPSKQIGSASTEETLSPI
jgi:hypothetical protein